MLKLLAVILGLTVMSAAADLPSKKYLDLAAIKTLVAGAEAEAQRQNVHVTICIVDDSANVIFLEKGDGTSLNTLDFARRKAAACGALSRPVSGWGGNPEEGEHGCFDVPRFFPEPGRTANQSRWTNRWRDFRQRC